MVAIEGQAFQVYTEKSDANRSHGVYDGRDMQNQLSHEKSPYLLQHAHNPVDWHPWGTAAFDKARREDKPIFLSIGYSTCHWCHVMERESFENEQIAQLLNHSFVSIKVDREERPDVDRIYMTYVQATTGSGGWPMSVFLTPDLKPFFGGTYFPPDNRYGRPGFGAILQSLAKAWKEDREKINNAGNEVISQLQSRLDGKGSQAHNLDRHVLDAAFQQFRRSYDSSHGGFGGAPKFPRPAVLNFLFRYAERAGSEEAREMVLFTLRAMAEGGMNDQLGGGFHRYSVDDLWFVPHFEKMLYDQAQLAIAYVEAYQITKDPFYAQVARNTLDYVLRDMTDAGGGFYSAEDADSVIDPANPHEKGEGAFYVWSRDEIEAALGKLSADIFADRYGIEVEGNVHNDPHGEFGGKNILFIHRSLQQVSERFTMQADLVEQNLNASIQKLMEVRSKRVRPHLDDKILTAWNGLMISAFAKAGQVLNEPRYVQAAQNATDFILNRMYHRDDDSLLRRYRDNDAAIPGFLDDYAFLIQGLLDCYETSFRTSDLDAARRLAGKMLDVFEDRENGGFFSTAEGDPNLVMRIKDDYDGAEPSGNSVAFIDLLRLGQITNDPKYQAAAERTLKAMAPILVQQPTAAPQLLVGLNYWQSPKRQIVVAGDADTDQTRGMLRKIRSHFLPNATLLLLDSEDSRRVLSEFNPALSGMHAIEGKTTAYVCENYTCQLPTNDISRLDQLLQ